MKFYSPPLLTWTENGLFCEAGGFHIDPHGRLKGKVDLAIITHAHSDHARRGSARYLCEQSGVELLRSRIGKNIQLQGLPYGKSIQLGEVTVSLHSAGHILGSAQIRIQRGAEVWVASGDYKRDSDPSCEPFEVVECDTFITEATFGTPKFVWDKDLPHGSMIHAWWNENTANNINSVLFGYSLGKAQRILAELAPFMKKPILIHPSIHELTECYRKEGRILAETSDLMEAVDRAIQSKTQLQGELILAPPSVLRETWANVLGDYQTAFASGWMQGQERPSAYGGGGYDKGFVISDHADWNDLNRTIDETKARRVFVQHRNGALIRHLKKKGVEAYPIDALVPERVIEAGGANLNLFEDGI